MGGGTVGDGARGGESVGLSRARRASPIARPCHFLSCGESGGNPPALQNGLGSDRLELCCCRVEVVFAFRQSGDWRSQGREADVVARWGAALRSRAAGPQDESPCGAIHKQRPS
jgi:hypothetical protein